MSDPQDNQDWTCPNCGDNNFRYRLRCWKCNTRSREKTKKLKSHDWVCVCGVMNFGRRLICIKCGRSKTDQERNISTPTPRPGDWICICGEHNFSKRKHCWKCHEEMNIHKVIEKEGDWLCKSCKSYNYSFRDICHHCNSIKYGVHEIRKEHKCVVCQEEDKSMAIKTCGHFCVCHLCGFVAGKCPVCHQPYDYNKDLIRIINN